MKKPFEFEDDAMGKKILLIVLSCILASFFIFMIIFNAVRYPIKLKIDSNEVVSANILYYGDGASQKVENRKDVRRLTNALNKLRFREHEDMSHLSPRSGVLIIDLYDADGRCIDSIQFYDWVYRGGEYKDKERKDGSYLSAKKGFSLGNIYKICDELSGDPFDRLQYIWMYWLMGWV